MRSCLVDAIQYEPDRDKLKVETYLKWRVILILHSGEIFKMNWFPHVEKRISEQIRKQEFCVRKKFGLRRIVEPLGQIRAKSRHDLDLTHCPLVRKDYITNRLSRPWPISKAAIESNYWWNQINENPNSCMRWIKTEEWLVIMTVWIPNKIWVWAREWLPWWDCD